VGKAIVILILALIISIPIGYAVSENFKFLFNPFTGKRDRTVSSDQSGFNWTFGMINGLDNSSLLTIGNITNILLDAFKNENGTALFVSLGDFGLGNISNYTEYQLETISFKIVNFTDRVPTCTGDDKITSADGLVLTCATDQTGGGGGAATTTQQLDSLIL